jgi:cysteine synthase A
MSRAHDSVLDAVGQTPIAKLTHIVPADAGDVFVKMEQLGLGGSVKTRTAFGMITTAERDGRLGPDSVIVEPTSGNQGIAVALVAAIKGYRARIVMPSTMSVERRRLIEAYGAEVVLTDPAETVQETFAHAIDVAYAMAEEDPHVVVLQQFENPANPAIHYATTGPEMWEQMEGRIDAFVCGVGTGGTITGVGRFLADQGSSARVIAVEPAAAPAIAGGAVSTHRQQGIGDGFVPHNCDLDVLDGTVSVTDEDALTTARRLAAEEGLAVGISSGSNVWAAMEVANELGEGTRVVTLLPDTAERYFSTELFER